MRKTAWMIYGQSAGSIPVVGRVYKIVGVDRGVFFGRILETDGLQAKVEVLRLHPPKPEPVLVCAFSSFLVPAPPCFINFVGAVKEGSK